MDPYLSPFFSPCLASNCEEATWDLFGTHWGFSPALLILPFPLGFRLTCYYYRKAYYRSFLWSPPACAVSDFRSSYTGETKFPLILQNAHRYFFFLALPFPIILLYDALRAFRFEGEFGMGLGTLILLANAVLLFAPDASVVIAAPLLASPAKQMHVRRALLESMQKPTELRPASNAHQVPSPTARA